VSANHGQRADLLSLAQGVWRLEGRSGSPDEGPKEGELFDKLRKSLRLRRAISDLALDKLILHIRSDNPVLNLSKEAASSSLPVHKWLGQFGVRTLYITPGSPRENGYNKSFNGSLRDEMLDGEIFYTLAEAKELIGAWRRHYTTVLPYSSLGCRPPAPGSGDTLARRRARHVSLQL
jgi:transposase InsO family protein